LAERCHHERRKIYLSRAGLHPILAGEVRGGSQVEISAGKGGLTFNGKRPLTADVEEFEPV
jgi:hypothetical protein